MIEPQPRIDAKGVPTCVSSCPHHRLQSIDDGNSSCDFSGLWRVYPYPCRPAVEKMAAELAAARAENERLRVAVEAYRRTQMTWINVVNEHGGV